MYTDDCNFITEIKRARSMNKKAKEIMTNKNLLVNEEKTEYTTVKRGSKEVEKRWRNVITLGSKFGDQEDPERKRIGNYCSCEEWHNLEKKLEDETDHQNPAIWDAIGKCTVVATTAEPEVYQRMIRENWTVFIEDSWEKWLRSSGHKKYTTINCIRSQEQNHCRSLWQGGDGSCWDTS